MAKEPFLLVSLKGEKAKKLAQVMANPTCTKILEYLAGKDATESQIAKDLGVPLSTVHYNIQQLVDARLVVADEFHYSEKGREVQHYKLANKYIIIAPQEDDQSVLQHLRKMLPLAIVTVGAAAVLKVVQILNIPVEEPAPMMAKIAVESDAMLMAADAGMIAPTPWYLTPMVNYFIAGALFVLMVLIVIETIRYLMRKRRS